MTGRAIDYSTTEVSFYKFVCNDPEIKSTYVGHTINFIARKAHHKKCCNGEHYKQHNLKIYQMIKQHLGWSNWRMIEIEKRIVKDKREAERIEQEYMEQLQSDMNMIKAFSTETKEEYYKTHKEEIAIRHKAYCEAHKEEVAIRHKAYREEHKEEIAIKNKAYYKENKEEIAIKKKAYREEHKEEFAIQHKEWREEHKEKIAIKKKAYYKENKEEIAIKKKAYREAHKEELAIKKKAYREAHKEELAIKKKVYYQKQKEQKKINAINTQLLTES